MRTSSELDLTNQQAVREFFGPQAIDEVYLAAARVGGIHANNTYPAVFSRKKCRTYVGRSLANRGVRVDK